MSYVSYYKYQDGVTDVLVENGITDEMFDEAADALAEHLERQSGEDVEYTVLGDDHALKPWELAEQVRRRTEVGVSYVETFIAGVLTSKRLGLQSSLEALRKAG